MMNLVVGMVIGALAWQLVTFVVAVATNEDDEAIIKVGTGAWFLVATIVCAIGRKLYKLYTNKYNCYQFFGKVSESKMDSKSDKWIHNYYMTEEVASQLRQCLKDEVPTEDYCVRLLRTGKERKSAPMKNEIITQKMLDNGFRGFDKEFLAKFKK